MNKDLNSPCFSCQWYRKQDFIQGRWVFSLPNQAEFASYEEEHAWCLIEVLDRFPAPLERAAACRFWESRDVKRIVKSYEELITLHPAYRG